jgi:hypothetical protein
VKADNGSAQQVSDDPISDMRQHTPQKNLQVHTACGKQTKLADRSDTRYPNPAWPIFPFPRGQYHQAYDESEEGLSKQAMNHRKLATGLYQNHTKAAEYPLDDDCTDGNNA